MAKNVFGYLAIATLGFVILGFSKSTASPIAFALSQPQTEANLFDPSETGSPSRTPYPGENTSDTERKITPAAQNALQKKVAKLGWSGIWSFHHTGSMIDYANNGEIRKIDRIAKSAGYDPASTGEMFRSSKLFSVPGYTEKYEVILTFILDSRSHADVYGFVEVKPQLGSSDRWDVFYYSVKTSPKTIASAMKDYFAKNAAKPRDSIAAAGFMGGKAVPEKTNAEIRAWFEKYGWNLGKNSFYQIDGNMFSNQTNRIAKLDRNAQSAGTIANVAYTEIYCAPKSGMKCGFYVDFCVSFRAPDKFSEAYYRDVAAFQELSTNKPYTLAYNGFTDWDRQYVWLIVKPARRNSAGGLDTYFFSATSTLSDIYRSMKGV